MTPPEDDKEVTQDIHPPAPGALSERYDLLGELGRGGMGVVYKARDKETGGVVALKVLQAEIAARPDVIERFKSELLLARKITHKNVCRTHELLRFGDTVVISMEYVEGESLRAVLRRFGGVPLRRGLEWTTQICSALAEAHAQGVVHRDLKPENILIARDGSAKVMDFGIARSLEPQATATAMATIIGTPAYMSPEQAEGKPVDHRTDIYALGLVLYEMFTGRPAFQADTPIGMLTALAALVLGTLYGAISGYIGGRVDNWMMRCVDIVYALPDLLLIILIMVILGRGFLGIFLALTLVSWVTVARIIRGEVLKYREQSYVEAARALGAGHQRILFRHILPNTLGPLIVILTFRIPAAILAESTLSFVGLGITPPLASWGTLANEGWAAMKFYPHLIVFPSLFIFSTILAFNFLGDGLRDALDPRNRRTAG